MLLKATSEQVDFYEKKLYPLQDLVLPFFNFDEIYLTGGTCLSRYYYTHRYSDDLDFFYDGFKYPKSRFNLLVSEIINNLSKLVDLKISLIDENFARFFIHHNTTILKVDIVFEGMETIGIRNQVNKNFYLDTKENVATNKLTAVYDRKTAKDFFDLYFLLKEFSLNDLLNWSEKKIIPFNYEGVLISFSDRNLQGSVLMINAISSTTFTQFSNDLIDKLILHAKNPS